MKNSKMQFALLLLVTLFSLTSAFGQIQGVIAGTDLTGGGMSGYVTLNLDTTQVPQLATPNTFTNNQTVNGNVNANSFSLGGYLFGSGSYTNENAFLGFAGNSTGGRFNTATGYEALFSVTASGQFNAADGQSALYSNTSGFNNTADGVLALYYNTTGGNNTGSGMYSGVTADTSSITGSLNSFLGYASTMSTGSLNNATAIGAFAEVAASNSMVLGSINGVNGATASTNVGIGTSKPGFLLEVYAAGASNAQIEMASTGTDAAISVNNKASGGREYWIDSGSGGAGIGAGNFAVYDRTAGSTRLVINSSGRVGIGTTSPDDVLSVNGSADKVGGGSWGTYSDGRLKNLNGRFNSGLSQVLKLNPVRYRYKSDNAMGIRDTDEHIGVVAQDVQRVIPEAVTENSKGYLLVNNDPIIWSMLNAIKEQQGEIRALKSELRATRQSLQKVQAQVAHTQPALVAAK
jgi:hypothetical protein